MYASNVQATMAYLVITEAVASSRSLHGPVLQEAAAIHVIMTSVVQKTDVFFFHPL